ncbi:MAG: preprotein translocase subunit YajC [Anaerolineae bacterium]|nr:MAG: preprotein translocase subunit YajC [Anaerolineae bacterium]
MFWFVLIRPQQRGRRQQQEMVESLQIGDEVISAGGLVGHVTRLPEDDGWICFELAPGVEIRLLTVAISHRVPADEAEGETTGEEFLA